MKQIATLLTIFFFAGMCHAQNKITFPANKVVPSQRQIEHQEMEIVGFIHFSVNTFTNREWGTGKENPDIFNPTHLNAHQWAEVAKEGGIKLLILTAKHHDGFCLWPSKYTNFSVKSSPWENGKGDVVKDLSVACRQVGIKFGLYLSPWDMHEPTYGTPAYITHYTNQLRELLTEYGPISEFFFDGAKSPEYQKKSIYDFPKWWGMIRKLQPQCIIFSDIGPDVRWIGNERGFAGKTNWSMFSPEREGIGKTHNPYQNQGDPYGTKWVTGECDVSIRPGWFNHPSQDSLVKSPQELVDLYYKSVGRNGVLLLNLPPNKEGLISAPDIKSVKEFHAILQATFAHNLAQTGNVKPSSIYRNSNQFAGERILDKKPEDTFWAADPSDNKPVLTIDMPKPVTFDRIMLQEPIKYGQRIAAFAVQAFMDGRWQDIAGGTTIGYKRLLRIKPVTASQVRIIFLSYNNTPALSNFGLYEASPLEGKP